MAYGRSFLSQKDSIFASRNYDDALTVSPSMTGSVTLEEDLNNIRTQLRQILWAGVSGSWYDAITAPSGGLSARGLNTINQDLTDLEQKRFLYRAVCPTPVVIHSSSNFALLSASLNTTPADYIAMGVTTQTGSIVAQLTGSGDYNHNVLTYISGTNAARPKNMVVVRDAYSGEIIQDTTQGNKDIYGLLQIENAGTDGAAFDDSTNKTQISFVVEWPSGTLVAASVNSIGGKHIIYSYPRRVALDDIPEDAYMTDSIFLDAIWTSASSGGGGSTTRQGAYDAQDTIPVELTNNAFLDLDTSISWYIRDVNNANLFAVEEDSASSNTKVRLATDVDFFEVSASINAFLQGARFDTGGTEIRIGEQAGTIETLTNSSLLISGGNNLQFADGHMLSGTYSPVAFSSGSGDWSGFHAMFGPGETILGAFTQLSQSISSSVNRTKYIAGVTADIAADTNVTTSSLDGTLGDYSSKGFATDLNIYLNGQLLNPGDSTNTNDVYAGDVPAVGDLKFPYQIYSGTIITMEIY